MEKKQKQTHSKFTGKSKIKRKGVHSKTKTSKLKHSKNWIKPYKGQG